VTPATPIGVVHEQPDQVISEKAKQTCGNASERVSVLFVHLLANCLPSLYLALFACQLSAVLAWHSQVWQRTCTHRLSAVYLQAVDLSEITGNP
jgi:hypothetical protein